MRNLKETVIIFNLFYSGKSIYLLKVSLRFDKLNFQSQKFHRHNKIFRLVYCIFSFA